jgi:hypothetical protein
MSTFGAAPDLSTIPSFAGLEHGRQAMSLSDPRGVGGGDDNNNIDLMRMPSDISLSRLPSDMMRLPSSMEDMVAPTNSHHANTNAHAEAPSLVRAHSLAQLQPVQQHQQQGGAAAAAASTGGGRRNDTMDHDKWLVGGTGNELNDLVRLVSTDNSKKYSDDVKNQYTDLATGLQQHLSEQHNTFKRIHTMESVISDTGVSTWIENADLDQLLARPMAHDDEDGYQLLPPQQASPKRQKREEEKSNKWIH